MGSPWSPATPGAKYWGALIPLEAVSMGRPGMEMGAPGRPGFASRTWSWMTMLCAGSGVVTDGAEATTVIDWWTAASCRVVPHCVSGTVQRTCDCCSGATQPTVILFLPLDLLTYINWSALLIAS